MSVNSDAVVQSGQSLSAEDVTQLAASRTHGRLRCAGWLGSVALACIGLLCGKGLVPQCQIVLVAAVCRVCQ